MFNDIANQKYPSITIQGVLLASSVLYLKHEGANIPIIFTIVIVLSLFVLQSLNHRFFYYFPINTFAEKETKSLDTYLLYFMTFLAFLLFIYGISNSVTIAIISTAIIILPGFIWKLLIYEKVRDGIAEKLGREKIIKTVKCPKCGGEAISWKKVFKWNHGYEIIECLDGCGHKEEKEVPLNIG